MINFCYIRSPLNILRQYLGICWPTRYENSRILYDVLTSIKHSFIKMNARCSDLPAWNRLPSRAWPLTTAWYRQRVWQFLTFSRLVETWRDSFNFKWNQFKFLLKRCYITFTNYQCCNTSKIINLFPSFKMIQMEDQCSTTATELRKL